MKATSAHEGQLDLMVLIHMLASTFKKSHLRRIRALTTMVTSYQLKNNALLD